LGGLGGVNLSAQLLGTAVGIVWAVVGGAVLYAVLRATMGLRLTQEEEFNGADLSVHRIGSTPEREATW
jgi:ammonium transporter, Amt family